jgi:hypothetical protein
MAHIQFVKFWCEWDIGYENCVFTTEDVCRKHVEQALKDCGIEEPVDELEAEGLVGFEFVNVIAA